MSDLFEHNSIFLELLILVWIPCLWELYANLRQRKVLQTSKQIPSVLEGSMSSETFEKARLYALDKNLYNIIKDLRFPILDTILLFAMQYYWKWSLLLVEGLGIKKHNNTLTSLFCYFIVGILAKIVDVSFEAYKIFVLEEKHGFNKQTCQFFIADQARKIVLHLMPLYFLSNNIVDVDLNVGEFSMLYIGIFVAIFALLKAIIYPEVIAPFLNKYLPIPEGELKQNLEKLALSLDFPVSKLYIIDVSKKSSHDEAYLDGFFKFQKIVISNTLVKKYDDATQTNDEESGCNIDEILAIVAHELGHWKMNHVLKRHLLEQLILGTNMFLFAMLHNYQPIYVTLGFTNVQPFFLGVIIIVTFIIKPINKIFSFGQAVNFRQQEFQADEFARKLGYGSALNNALITLEKQNLSWPLFDKFYSSLYNSHPPLLERLAGIAKKDE